LFRAGPNRQNRSVRESGKKSRSAHWALVWAFLYFCAPLGQLGTDLVHDLHHRLMHGSSDHVHPHLAAHLAHDAMHTAHRPGAHEPHSHGVPDHDHSGAHGHGTAIDLLLVLFEHAGTRSSPLPDRDSSRHWEHLLPSVNPEPSFGWFEALAARSEPLTPPARASIERPPRFRA